MKPMAGTRDHGTEQATEPGPRLSPPCRPALLLAPPPQLPETLEAASWQQVHPTLPNKEPDQRLFWVALKELKLSYHNPKTVLFTTCPYYGNLI